MVVLSELVVRSGVFGWASSGTTSILGNPLERPAHGGLYLYFLKKIAGSGGEWETAFTGFRHPFPHLVIAGFLATLLTNAGFFVPDFAGHLSFCGLDIHLPLIVDRRLEFWPAMRLSRKIISKHWWNFGIPARLALINLVGIAAICVASLSPSPSPSPR